jgi:hypothetical protein
MAILSTDKRDVSVSNDFKTSGFKIQASAKAFEILSSNIYTNKVRAVIREYNCNAYDAHVAAGNGQPWDVHLPTYLESYFSVRDYGTGLSDEQVREIFTTYFHSTKTNSNDFVGALGLGSKSAFSIVDSFNVVSYYNGVKTDYCCYKDEHGEPQVATLASSDTVQQNGLEVSMSVEGRTDDFTDEAVNVFKYFDVLPNINDKEVVKDVLKAKEDYKFVCDEGSFNTGYGSLYARMGNVAYKIPSEYRSDLSGFINFEIGDLSFNAGREELSMDDSTKKLLKSRIQQVQDNLSQVVYDKLEAEQCKFTRAKKKAEVYSGSMRSVLRSSTLDFDKFDLPSIKDGDERITSYKRGTWHRDSPDIESLVRLPLVNSNDWKIRYFLHKDRMKTRIMEWMRNQRGSQIVLLKQEQIDLLGIPADLIEDLDEVVPKSSNSYGGSTPTRSKVTEWNGKTTGWRVKANECWDDVEIDNDGRERVYVEINRYESQGYNMDSFNNIMDSLDHLIIGFGRKIYGLKTAFLKTKGFKQGNWISLSQYIERETKALPDITVIKFNSRSHDGPYQSLFKKLSEGLDNDILKQYNDTIEAAADEHSDKFAYNTLNLVSKIKCEDRLQNLADEFAAQYPVVELLHWDGSHASDRQIEVLINHIQGETK